MLIAAIDIGSNAVRLLFAEANKEKQQISIRKHNLIRVPIRLGKDVYTKGVISKKREENFINTMKAFDALIKVYKPKYITACATAAMREASNGKEVLKRIKSETGLKIRLIDGVEEARIIRKTNKIDGDNSKAITMFIDVGGGSTEISVVKKNKLIRQESFKIGTIRLLNNKIKPKQWRELEKWLDEFKFFFGSINIIGSGGNINKLAKLFGNKKTQSLSYQSLQSTYKIMDAMTVKERMKKYHIREDRADVIVPAAKIFLTILEQIKGDKVFAPKIGVADGLVYELYEKYLEKNDSK